MVSYADATRLYDSTVLAPGLSPHDILVACYIALLYSIAAGMLCYNLTEHPRYARKCQLQLGAIQR